MSNPTALLTSLPPPAIRAMLAPWIAGHLADPALEVAATRVVEEAVLPFDDDALDRLRGALLSAGTEWAFYAADPVARAISRAFMPLVARPATVVGLDRLDRFIHEGSRRKLVVCNHLSYTDTQVTDSVLTAAGRAGIADRLVAVAGPKVYTDPWRRMAAVALNTRKVAQSTQVASEQAPLSPRDLARLALEALEDLIARMDDGAIVLLYAEGTRSPDGRLQPFLRAVQRYLALSDLTVLPMCQTGTERVFPREQRQMFRAPVELRFGEPFYAEHFPGKGAALSEAWGRVAGLLPEAYQPQAGLEALL